MAYSANKIVILGRVGQDPEMRATKSGKAVCKLRVATDSGWGDNKETDWHSIVLWDKLAEITGRIVNRGDQVYIEGQLRYRTWETRDGGKRTDAEIHAREAVFLPKGKVGQQQRPSDDGGWGEPNNSPEPKFDKNETIPF